MAEYYGAYLWGYVTVCIMSLEIVITRSNISLNLFHTCELGGALAALQYAVCF